VIQQDIGEYKYRPKSTIEIRNSGVLIGAGHFDLDHDVITFEATYIHPVTIVAPDVIITQHAGSESDKWLLHEVEMTIRDTYGTPGNGFLIRQIDNNTVLTYGLGGWIYRWVSGNKVINIQYHDSQMTKPEPLEVVKVYLAKYPSTLPPMTSASIRTVESKTKWVKDSMERDLWLCDKWFAQLDAGKAKQEDVLKTAVKYMKIFLNKQQNFFGTDVAAEKQLLREYQKSNDAVAIKDKLAEYKSWWSSNKTRALPNIGPLTEVVPLTEQVP